MMYNAIWLPDNDRPAAEVIALAHAYGRDAVGIVIGNAYQVHGGIGFTKEYPLHHFSRRAKVYEVSHGQAAFPSRAVGAASGPGTRQSRIHAA
jgi:alkylation response protein AidB-like acyl-CoA dehydrogenase